MDNKTFDLGIMVGRFQTFHKGHEYMIDKAVGVCQRVGIFIGSSQESGTQKNPYTYQVRESILRKVFGNNIDIFPLPDIGVGNNSKWGDYVLENVKQHYGKSPDLLISGKEERRISWFDSVEGNMTAELYIPKVIEISATQMREYLIKNDMVSWKKYTNPLLWNEFDELREAVLCSMDNTKTDSI